MEQRYNKQFPPTSLQDKYSHNGYTTPAQECLFYDFAMQGYDLMIQYKGNKYYFMVDKDCVWLSDKNFTKTNKRFKDGNDVLTNFLIDGTPLYQLVDKLEDYEAI